MLTWRGHGGFSIDASVHIPAHDRHGLERLLRYCARPPFAAERISLPDQKHSQEHSDHRPDDDQPSVIYQLPPGDVYGRTELTLNPFQFIQRLTQLIPPPRLHRNRYFGAFAAASPLRPHVVKFASPEPQLAERLNLAAAQMNLFDADSHDTATHEQPPPDSPPDSLPDSAPDSLPDSTPDSAEALPEAPPPEHRRRRRASILWAMLLARICRNSSPS